MKKLIQRLIANVLFLPTYVKLKKTQGKKRIVILAVPQYNNIGDHAITMAEEKFLETRFPELACVSVGAIFSKFIVSKVKKMITQNDIIAIHGGGFLGTLWGMEPVVRRAISDFPKNNKIIFPQTVFFSPNEEGNRNLEQSVKTYRESNVRVFVREENSYKLMKDRFFPDTENRVFLVPDMVLSLSSPVKNEESSGIILCMRNDAEKVTGSDIIKNLKECARNVKQQVCVTDMCTRFWIPLFLKDRFVTKKMKQLASAKFVVTDRLHCMIFCTLVGTPCIAMDNSSKKVKGVYEKWLKDLDYIVFCENENDALSKAEEWIKADSIQVTRYSPKDLESAFAPLTQAIKDCLA